VAKGFTQKEEEDLFDTYSHVARITTIRVLLALAASHGLHIHQIDVKAAFLYGVLDEEIYIWSSQMVIKFMGKRTKCAD
jgi:hypothetical protein